MYQHDGLYLVFLLRLPKHQPPHNDKHSTNQRHNSNHPEALPRSSISEQSFTTGEAVDISKVAICVLLRQMATHQVGVYSPTVHKKSSDEQQKGKKRQI